MINKILMGIFKIVIGLVNVLLTPINLLITNFLPDISSVIGLITNLFNTIFRYIGWVIDASFINSETVSLIIAIYTFKLTVPLAISTIKLALKWYNSLKL